MRLVEPRKVCSIIDLSEATATMEGTGHEAIFERGGNQSMLTIFHTADWHLGQSFFGYDRDQEHAAFLDWLLDQLKNQQPNALLISGDVFDTVNPSALAQRRYYDFLARAHAACDHLHIVIVAGNHDAGARLEAPHVLFNAMRISVVGTVARKEQGEIELERLLVPVCDSRGQVQAVILAVPFLRPSDVPMVVGATDPYLEGIRELYRSLTALACRRRDEHWPDAPLIAMGHCHLSGGNESRDSERRLVIGGSEAVQMDVFSDQLAYVALGHLHKAQQFRQGTVRYSGSPVPLSFAEMHYPHQVLRLQFDRQQLVATQALSVPRSTPLVCVPHTGFALIEDVLTHIAELTFESELAPEQYPFLEVRVIEDQPDPTRRRKIEQALEGKPVRLASIKVEYPGRKNCEGADVPEQPLQDLRSLQPEEVFLNAYQEKYGGPADEALVAAFREILLRESHTS